MERVSDLRSSLGTSTERLLVVLQDVFESLIGKPRQRSLGIRENPCF
jgi:hypothetical protein